VWGINVGNHRNRRYVHPFDTSGILYGRFIVRRRMVRAFALLLALGLCLGVGGLGALATTPEIENWYRTLTRPAWTPPDWVFGPVWTALYVMMAVAAWLVWAASRSGGARAPLAAFGLQLLLNLGWSWLFFGLHEPGWAAVEILALLVAIAVTIRLFLPRSRMAASLLVPYFVWVGFAAALNFTIWRLNP
jgi:tryptophan-rich sensory protein